MTTRSEHREYIASVAWKSRRDAYLIDHPWCDKCALPRRISRMSFVYDQDLHVHHKSYLNSGCGKEPDEDLQTLCARCHEIETFGQSDKQDWDRSNRAAASMLFFLAESFDFLLKPEYIDRFFQLFHKCSWSALQLTFSEAVQTCIAMPTPEHLLRIYELNVANVENFEFRQNHAEFDRLHPRGVPL